MRRARLVAAIVGLAVTWGVAVAEQEIPQPDIPSRHGFNMEAVGDLTRLVEILRADVPGVRGREGFWEMVISSVTVKAIADQTHSRMRVIAAPAHADEPGVARPPGG